MLGDYEDGGVYDETGGGQLQHYASPADKGGRLNKTEELQEMILEIEDDSGKVVWRCVACGKLPK